MQVSSSFKSMEVKYERQSMSQRLRDNNNGSGHCYYCQLFKPTDFGNSSISILRCDNTWNCLFFAETQRPIPMRLNNHSLSQLTHPLFLSLFLSPSIFQPNNLVIKRESISDYQKYRPDFYHWATIHSQTLQVNTYANTLIHLTRCIVWAAEVPIVTLVSSTNSKHHLMSSREDFDLSNMRWMIVGNLRAKSP